MPGLYFPSHGTASSRQGQHRNSKLNHEPHEEEEIHHGDRGVCFTNSLGVTQRKKKD
jgi:hypothetical protein